MEEKNVRNFVSLTRKVLVDILNDSNLESNSIRIVGSNSLRNEVILRGRAFCFSF